MKPTLEQLVAALQDSWAVDTAYDATDWNEQNPARGQCVVSALVVQGYLGGGLQRYEVKGEDFEETHYANKIGGVIIDTTASQYDGLEVNLRPTPANLKGFSSLLEKRLADKNTRERYERLKRRVEAILGK
jgi:hypothetical protein